MKKTSFVLRCRTQFLRCLNRAKYTLLASLTLTLILGLLGTTYSLAHDLPNTHHYHYLSELEYNDLYEVCGILTVDCDNSYAQFDTWVGHSGSNPSAAIKEATMGWMGKLPDSLKLSEMSIPGTHDSAAESPEGVGVATQDWDIKEQLEAGIRVFDVRVRKVKREGRWDIYHGSTDLELTFEQVMTWMNDFLDNNVNEAIILRIQPAVAGEGAYGENGATWSHYFDNEQRILSASADLTLGQVRNKIVRINTAGNWAAALKVDLQNYWKVYNYSGECYGNDCGFAEDGPQFATIGGKEKVVKEFIDKPDGSKWVINGLEGSTGMTPASVAAEVNRVAYFHLNEKSSNTNVGTLMMDFPGEGLIYRIIKTNFVHYKRIDVNLQVDCFDGLFTGWGTYDDITVKFYNGTELLGTKTQVPGCDNSFGDSFFNINAVTAAAPQLMTHIEVSTNGKDAFIMDELYFQRTKIAQSLDSPTDGYDGGKEDEELIQFGRDGGMGWCLSKDPSDDDGDTAGCHEALRFEITSEKVYKTTSSTKLTREIAVFKASGTPLHQQGYSFGTNTAPTVDAGGPYTVAEGDNVELSIASSFDVDGDPLTFKWDLNNDGLFEASGPTQNFTGINGPENLTVTVRVSDGTLTSTDSATVNVTNVAPTISKPFISPTSAVEGESVTVSGKFTDPALSVELFSGSAKWSDGVKTPLRMNSVGTFSTSRDFTDDHPASGTPADAFTVNITINDGDGGSDDETSQAIIINNVAPSITSTNLSSSSIVEGGWITVSGTFVDPALGVATETFSGSAQWSDGVSTPLTVSPDGTFTTSRIFPDDHPESGTAIDLFTVMITIEDDDEGSATEVSQVITVNNVAPKITATNLSASTIVKGESVIVSGTFVDPALGISTETFEGSAQWSDGVSTPLTISSGSFSTSRNFPVDQLIAAYTVTVDIMINDDDTGSHIATSPALTIVITPESIINSLNKLHENADIDRKVVNSLRKKLTNAMRKHNLGQCRPASNMYRALISQVNAQRGKKIKNLAANVIIQDAEYLIVHCP